MQKLNSTLTRIADLGKPRVIVIGGGFGGMEVIKGLKGVNAQAVLIDRFNHHCFQPLLYQVATSGLETNSIVVPFRKRFASQEDFFFRLAEVNRIIPEENLIETSIGQLRYDYLVIASGATTNFYGMGDVAENSLPMKTIIDSIKLRNIIIRNFENALLTDDLETMNSFIDFVIVGGGPTGVELAGALSELKNHVFPRDYPELELAHMDIHLIEATPRLLNGMSEKSGDKALEYLQEMGVQVHLNMVVQSYDGRIVKFKNGDELRSRTVIWAAGVTCQPIQGIKAEALGRGSRILTDEFNLVKGYSNVFAIGDAALVGGDPDFPKGHPQMAPPAMQQGRLVAKNIQRLLEKRALRPFRYHDKGSMATVGRNKAVVDMKRFQVGGFLAWFIWMFVHLISIVGFRNKFFVFLSWLWSYFSYDKSNRIIIARPKDGVQ
jgi:NADH:ubiquinone reductase (H+-translocating)